MRGADHPCGDLWGTDMRPKKTILCVDDNEQALSIRKFMLETRGYQVVSCANGRDAVSTFMKGGIDLVLCDLMMPDIDGAEVIRQIKARSPETPTIIFSGKIKIYDKDLHADIFLPKGMFAPAELLERIRVLLIRKRGPKKASIPVASTPVSYVAAS
jgi:two-component system response regulator CpxR